MSYMGQNMEHALPKVANIEEKVTFMVLTEDPCEWTVLRYSRKWDVNETLRPNPTHFIQTSSSVEINVTAQE